MSYLFQISDPEDLRVTIQFSGKYNPDLLEDGKRRVVDAYKDALNARLASASAQLDLEAKYNEVRGEDESE